jgi:ribosomal protein S18 acetylase RimI-like enzyme
MNLRGVAERSDWLDRLEVGALDPSSVEEALGVLVRGMRDNPTHVAAFGQDPERRQRSLRYFFGAAFTVIGLHEHMIVARSEDERVVGVLGMMPPGACLPGSVQKLRMLPALLRNGPSSAGRVMRWIGAWSERDPAEGHWHLGPLVVDAHLQGKGVGGRLMQVFCAQVDAARDTAYLETDKEINVRFYERFGFGVIGEAKVLGMSTYFMQRTGRR